MPLGFLSSTPARLSRPSEAMRLVPDLMSAYDRREIERQVAELGVVLRGGKTLWWLLRVVPLSAFRSAGSLPAVPPKRIRVGG